MTFRDLPGLNWEHNIFLSARGYPPYTSFVFKTKQDNCVDHWQKYETKQSKMYLKRHPEVMVLFSMLVKSFIKKRPICVRKHLETFFKNGHLKKNITDALEEMGFGYPATDESSELAEPADVDEVREILAFTHVMKHHPRFKRKTAEDTESSDSEKEESGLWDSEVETAQKLHRQIQKTKDGHLVPLSPPTDTRKDKIPSPEKSLEFELSENSMWIDPEDPKEFSSYRRFSDGRRLAEVRDQVRFRLFEQSTSKHSFKSAVSLKPGARQIGSHHLPTLKQLFKEEKRLKREYKKNYEDFLKKLK